MFVDIRPALGLRELRTLAFSIGLLVLSLVSSPAQAQSAETEIRGFPDVIDADILKFGQQRVILWGIDAPERPQRCQLNGTFWGCYDTAKRQLQCLAGRGEVRCTYVGEPDPFGRRFGVCSSGGEDLNAKMVTSGLALAFDEQTDDYMLQMVDAITEGVGLWQAGVLFEEPWNFRRRENPSGHR